MKKILYLLFFISVASFAQVPGTLSYQGILTDANGNPVADGPSVVTFKFYSVASGGSPIAGSTRGPLNVTTTKGLFTVVIGDGTTNNAALPGTLFNSEFWVGVTVGVGGTELTPRVQMTAVPYAYRAQVANALDASTTLAGTQVGPGINGANITTGVVALTNGGTGASTAINARSNLGLGPLATIGAITTSEITDGTIVTADLANSSVTSAKMAANAVTSATINDLSITTADIADGAVTNAKLATGIDAGKITTGTLPPAQIGPSSIDNSKLASGIDASKITTGTLTLTGNDASKLAAGTTAQRPGVPVEGQIRYNSTEKVMEYYNGTNWYFLVPKVAFLKDVKSSGTLGGTFTSGAFRTRDLNTLEGDISFVSLSSNRFTLSAGEYIVEASAPGHRIANNKILLVNITDNVNAAIGTSEYFRPDAAAEGQGRSWLEGQISITSSKQFEIQHRCDLTFSAYGLGTGTAYGISEVYTQVKLTKLR